MLFNVKVVSEADYQAHIASLKAAGYTGQLDSTYNRNQNLPGTSAPKSNG
jgi:cytochrome c oxidase subunit 2